MERGRRGCATAATTRSRGGDDVWLKFQRRRCAPGGQLRTRSRGQQGGALRGAIGGEQGAEGRNGVGRRFLCRAEGEKEGRRKRGTDLGAWERRRRNGPGSTDVW
jgi:hypothetical protein